MEATELSGLWNCVDDEIDASVALPTTPSLEATSADFKLPEEQELELELELELEPSDGRFGDSEESAETDSWLLLYNNNHNRNRNKLNYLLNI